MNIKKQSFLNLIITYSGFFLALFNTFFKTRIITPEEIGVMSIIISLTGIISYFILLGIPNIFLKFLPKYDRNEQTGIIVLALIFNICLFILVSIFLLIFKTRIIVKYNNDLFGDMFFFIFIYSFSSVFYQFFDVIFRINFNTVFPVFLKDFLFKVLHLILIITLVIFKLNFKVYISFYFGLNLLIFIILVIYFISQKYLAKPTFLFVKNKDYIKFFSYAFFVVFSGLAGNLVTQVDKLMLGLYSSFEEIGIYTIAVTIGSIIGLVGSAFSRISHSVVSHDLNNNDSISLKKNYTEVGEIQFMIASLMIIMLYFIGKECLGVLGFQYEKGYFVIIIIGFSQVVNLATSTCGGIIALSKYFKFDLLSRLILLGLNIILNTLLIPLYGINGAAIATSASLILYNIIKILFVKYKFDITPFSSNYIKVIISTVTLFLLIYFFKDLFQGKLILKIIFVFIYVALYYVLLIIQKFDNNYFISINNKWRKNVK